MLPFASPFRRFLSAPTPAFCLLLFALILVCSGAARADSFSAGQYVTYGQVEWGDVPNGTNAATLLADNYNAVYLPTVDVFTIGIPDPGYSVTFTGSDELLTYMPEVALPGVLGSDAVNPSTLPSGSFGGDIAALKLNIDFSDAGLLPSGFGNLWLTGLGSGLTGFNGITVRQFEGDMNSVLGGGTSFPDILQLDTLVFDVTASFNPTYNDLTFADAHLTATDPNGGGTTPTPEPSSLLLLASGLLALGIFHYRQRRHGPAMPN
jgi:PEP-CTERM motif